MEALHVELEDASVNRPPSASIGGEYPERSTRGTPSSSTQSTTAVSKSGVATQSALARVERRKASDHGGAVTVVLPVEICRRW